MTSQGELRAALLADASESTRISLANEITPLYIDLTSGILLDLLTDLNAANGTRHFVDPADDYTDWYAYTTRNRQYKLGASADEAIVSGNVHDTAIDGWRVTADTVINQQIATVDEPDFPIPPIKVWEWQNLPPLPLTIKAGAPLTVKATYSDYVLSCPDLVIVSSGDDLTSQLLHHGYDSDVVLTSEGTTVVKALTIEGRQALRRPELTHKANDTGSQALPRGIRAGPEISGDFVGAFASAIGISEHMTWRYGTPTKRPSMTLVNWLPYAFELDLFDVITYTSVQLKVTALAFEIVGLSEQALRAPSTGAVHWVTTYQLQEQKVHDPFFTLDDSLLDGDDALGY